MCSIIIFVIDFTVYVGAVEMYNVGISYGSR